MSNIMSTTIVFGPTGNIASIAAQTAEERGAKVILAMRDPLKRIRGLNAEVEKNGKYERVQADLADPESVSAAVKSTGATRAFLYLAFGTPDNMKSTLTALKTAGVQFVVFLSSSSIQVSPASVSSEEFIPYLHAQVELNLAQIFDKENYVAVRPGRFATNLLRYKQGIIDGEVRLHGGEFKFDNITPEDMGTVSGELLVNGAQTNQEVVYLYAPRWLSVRDSLLKVAKVLGMEIKISTISKDECVEEYVKAGLPRPLGQYLAKTAESENDPEVDNTSLHEQGRENIRTYAKRPPMTLEDWVARNRDLFSAA